MTRKPSLFRTLAVPALALAVLALAAPARATIVDNVDVNGFRTFRDVNTGRIWLDMDNFSNITVANAIGIASAAGFTFATRADVDQLLGTLPLTGGEWPSYNAIMGGSAGSRDLIWGAYDDVDTNLDIHGYAWAFGYDTAWNIVDVATYADSSAADLGIFAYRNTGQVPEPATLGLLAMGLAGLGFARRRRR